MIKPYELHLMGDPILPYRIMLVAHIQATSAKIFRVFYISATIALDTEKIISPILRPIS